MWCLLNFSIALCSLVEHLSHMRTVVLAVVALSLLNTGEGREGWEYLSVVDQNVRAMFFFYCGICLNLRSIMHEWTGHFCQIVSVVGRCGTM